MGPVEFASVEDVMRLAELTELSPDVVTEAIEGSAVAQNHLGDSLVQTVEYELGLAFLTESAYQGLPWAVSNFNWNCIHTEEFERARNLFEVATAPCELFILANDEDESFQQQAAAQWVNARSNDALCSLALGEDPTYALTTWDECAATGHAESLFYPALALYRSGSIEEAKRIVNNLDSEVMGEIRTVLWDGGAASQGWFQLWCEDGLDLLVLADADYEEPEAE